MRLSALLSVALACSLRTLLVRGDVYPYYPAGDLQTAGQSCRIEWQGDKSSTTTWKGMTITLMSGDNFNMNRLVVAASNQDGTVDGSFTWNCPQVTPNAAIYFYQFDSAIAGTTPEWTTRFPIASSSGQVTSPPNSTQPDGKAIPWGVGQLVGASSSSNSPSSTKPPTTSSTPANIAPGVAAGCKAFMTQTTLLCFQFLPIFNITQADFEAWNGGPVCDTLQSGLAYCVDGGPSVSTNPTHAAAPVSTPTNVAAGVVAGCSAFYQRANGALCNAFFPTYGITEDQFNQWNGGTGACNRLQDGKAYCVAHSGTTAAAATKTVKTTNSPTAATPVSTPTNVASGVVAGCSAFYQRANGALCSTFFPTYSITEDQFNQWNGGTGACNRLQDGKAYCVAHSGTTAATTTVKTTNSPTAAAPVSTPTNVAAGIIAGCSAFYQRANGALCSTFFPTYGITEDQFNQWNGGTGACNRLQDGKAYCVAHSGTTAAAATTPKTTNSPTAAAPVSTPTNVAAGVVSGCSAFHQRANGELCTAFLPTYGITEDQFNSLNGGAGACNRLENGKSYCVAGSGVTAMTITSTPKPTTTANPAPPPVSTPTDIAASVAAGCTSFFQRTNGVLCSAFLPTYGITEDQFNSLNGGTGACNRLENNKAYCVAGPGVNAKAGASTANSTPSATAASSVSTPSNVAAGVVAGCSAFYQRTNGALCNAFLPTYSITEDQFNQWNGGMGACNRLEDGKAYCVAQSSTTNSPTAAAPVSTPSTVSAAVVAGCSAFYLRSNGALCNNFLNTYSITVAEFEAWNGGTGACGRLEDNKSYCVSGPPTSSADTIIVRLLEIFGR